jgi:hypothetical protein
MPSDINKPIFFIIPSILPAKVLFFTQTTKPGHQLFPENGHGHSCDHVTAEPNSAK